MSTPTDSWLSLAGFRAGIICGDERLEVVSPVVSPDCRTVCGWMVGRPGTPFQVVVKQRTDDKGQHIPFDASISFDNVLGREGLCAKGKKLKVPGDLSKRRIVAEDKAELFVFRPHPDPRTDHVDNPLCSIKIKLRAKHSVSVAHSASSTYPLTTFSSEYINEDANDSYTFVFRYRSLDTLHAWDLVRNLRQASVLSSTYDPVIFSLRSPENGGAEGRLGDDGDDEDVDEVETPGLHENLYHAQRSNVLNNRHEYNNGDSAQPVDAEEYQAGEGHEHGAADEEMDVNEDQEGEQLTDEQCAEDQVPYDLGCGDKLSPYLALTLGQSESTRSFARFPIPVPEYDMIGDPEAQLMQLSHEKQKVKLERKLLRELHSFESEHVRKRYQWKLDQHQRENRELSPASQRQAGSRRVENSRTMYGLTLRQKQQADELERVILHHGQHQQMQRLADSRRFQRRRARFSPERAESQ